MGEYEVDLDCSEITYEGNIIKEKSDETVEEKKERELKKSNVLNSYIILIILSFFIAIVVMIFSYVFSKMNDSIKNIKGGRRIFRR